MYSHGPITLGPMSISPSNICMVICHRPIIAGPKSCKVHSHRHIAWRPNVYVVLGRPKTLRGFGIVARMRSRVPQ